MRTSLLLAGLTGLFPAVVFAATLLLSDGAPLRPIDADAASEAAPAPDRATPAAVSDDTPAGAGDRLRELARGGDPDAAILLTILDDSRGDRGSSGR